MIPVYGFPILNKPNLMKRMLDSVDHDIDRLFIVDNGGVVDPKVVRQYRANNVHVADPGFNMGVAGSWNFIIRANIQAPWWLIGCNDMVIQRGILDQVVADMEEHAGTPHMCRVVMGNESSWGNHFGLFALNPESIDMIGWFDENLYPIYFEDNDYMERVRRAKNRGYTDTLLHSTTHHDGNASWKDIPHNAVGNKRTWDINGPYYHDKWHTDVLEYDYPFDIGEEAGLVRDMDGLSYFPQPRVSQIREQDWRVDRKDNVKNDGIFS